ncbi:MAG: excinuclease ABC subunit UvrC [Chlamydiales bacterium]
MMTFDIQQLKHFPESPGVYLMKSVTGTILYIGKAKNLRSRTMQYFTTGHDRRKMVPYLIAQIATIDIIVVSSEKEALILENNLIKKHLPKYNALLKDDKTYFSLMINHKHQWPMIRMIRFKGEASPDHLYFGPYTNGHAARQTLELLRSLFPLRQCSDKELASRSRPCILYEMKKCSAPCVQKCHPQDYHLLVKKVINFLQGKEATIRKKLKTDMQQAIKNLEFEKADQIYQTLKYIEQTLEKQEVEKIQTHDLDVIGMFRQIDQVVVVQLFFRQGKLMGSHNHLFIHNAQEDIDLLTSFLLQHYGDQKRIPHEILLPFPLSKVVALLVGATLTHPKQGRKRHLLDMAEKNAKAQFQYKMNFQEAPLLDIEEICGLTHYPDWIECFDNSNMSGSEAVSAMVVFKAGKKDTKSYRKYTIQTAAPSDDYGMLKEALIRRYQRSKEKDTLPDLLLIDGGKGHLNLAIEILTSLNISTIDVISIAKDHGRHDRGIAHEQIFLKGQHSPLILKPDSPTLLLLQRIRDEAHRFAIHFQRIRNRKKSLASELDHLPGIGPIKKQRLLNHFGSLKRILEASEEEWKSIQGITKKDIETLRLARPPSTD